MVDNDYRVQFMKAKYRIVIIITSLLVILSISISAINYFIALHSTQKQLQERSLPLTVDNIYTEIQKHIIEPNLVSSMMAHDTFLKDWLINEEDTVAKIVRYLETIKNRYHMFTTFLVSEKTKNYYTSKGLIEQIKEDNPQNKWYFNFKEFQNSHEINLDFNNNIDSSLIMFINYKIFDDESHMIGATGIGLKISYINDMLKRFRQKFLFNVYFINKNGKVVLSERGINNLKNIDDDSKLAKFKDELISKEDQVLQYVRDDESYLIKTKYIPELDLHLIVEAKISNFTQKLKQTFYLNLFISLLVTIIVTLIIIYIIRSYNVKLEHLANYDTLTNLPNRRTFNERLEHFFLLKKRQNIPLSILLIDIDNFKSINDTQGHLIGDKVLQRISKVLKNNIRKTDIIARWGGEEFTIVLINANADESKIMAEKLRKSLEVDSVLYSLAKHEVTGSFGLSEVQKNDTISSLLQRVDDALYKAKASGKNCTVYS